ncbi:MAG: glycosyltransferase family 25 protein [Hyphomicrobiales bacterium]|nr:glycosyltransferase family 25 protein [Hyphomicrobiales bacterium]
MLQDFAAFVINLDRSPDRLQSAGEQCAAVGLRWQRVSAIDATTLPEVPRADYDVARFEWHVGRKIDPTEIAFAFSHLKAIRAFLDSPARFGLIVEDDFNILDRNEFCRTLAALADDPDSWDLVRLSCSSSRYPLPVKIKRLTARHDLAAPLMKFSCAAAYLLNRRAAAALSTTLLPIDDPFDHLLDNPWRHGLQYRITWPVLVAQILEFGHTIEYSRRSTKPMPMARIGALAHRMRIGLQRIAYNLQHGLFLRQRARYR